MPPEQKPKKILFIITKSNFGGAQRYVYDLATNLPASDFEVAVAAGGAGELKTRLEEKGIPYYEIGGLTRDISLKSELKSLQRLWQIVRTVRPDIVHLNSSKAGVLGSIIARLCGVKKIVFTAHGWPFLENRSRSWRLLAWLGSYLTAIFAHTVILVSQNDLRYTKMPGVKHKCQVIYPALPPIQLLERCSAREALYDKTTIDKHLANFWLVTHGEINHNKNLLTAINAVAEFNSSHNTKVFYTIIGTGDLENELKAEVELKGMNDYICFLGYKNDARQYLTAFDVYLLPSKKEGLPFSLLEAGFAGLLVVASKIGGIPEVVIDTETGLLSDPDNHMSIVDALDYLIDNPNERAGFIAKLQTKIKTEFTQGEMIEKTIGVY
jgi:glycosyltransferase involved in cell wall biosynthesis